MLCDYNLERATIKKHFAYLNALPPIKRFAEKFRLETEAVELELRQEDEIVGWFKFEGMEDECPQFDDAQLSAEEQQIIDAPSRFGTYTSVDRGHTLIDYETILTKGFIFYEKKIEQALSLHPDDPQLTAMQDTLRAVQAFSARLVHILEQKIRECDTSSRDKLMELQRIIGKVPYHPAENFREAIQSIWIVHFLTPLAENAWYSISLGRADQFLYPFYQKAIADGTSRQELKAILHNLYRLLNSYADGACLMNVGPAYNELSLLLVECQKEFALPAPILGARVNTDTSSAAWSALIDEKLFSMGQPTFYGETACANALLEKGLSAQEAKAFSNNSCMGISIAGNEFNSMWGCSWRTPAILETAVNSGRLLGTQYDFQVPDMEKPQNIEALWDNFRRCAEYMFSICAASYEKRAEVSERNEPDCFVSLLTPGCIEKRCDRISGAKYHNVTVECFGMMNTADGIHAVDQLVFQEKKYTLEALSDAVRNDFIGQEAIRRDILNCTKFGENTEADTYAVRVADILQQVIRAHRHDNLHYAPSLHTLDSNVHVGKEWGASYDGRRAGAPFAKNAGATNEVRKPDPTSMVLSCSKLPQHQFFGGQPIDVNFPIDTVRNHPETIRALIQVYLERGGLQFQVNALSSKLLREATAHPEQYPNLVVRIGGYSILFSQISQASKEEFIERFEKEGC